MSSGDTLVACTELILEFDRALQSGQKPEIEAFCSRASSYDGDYLLYRLIRLELIYIMERGSRPSSEQYKDRFPGNDELIEDAFQFARQKTGLPISEKYRIIKPVGEGGFGRVYEGVEILIERPVAIKIPDQSKRGTPRWINLFVSEARKAASLRHPGIVSIYELHTPTPTDSSLFVAMEFLDQGTLTERIKAGLDPATSARIMAQVAEAVHYAHGQKVFHCDLKPDNILIDRNDHPRITDFGLSRRLDDHNTVIAHVSSSNSASDRSLIGGTAAYMSPEQWRNETPTAQNDIWSMGVVLYELLWGRLPFMDVPLDADARANVGNPQRPDNGNLKIPGALERAYSKCLAIQPKDRYRTADELRRDLNRWLTRKQRNIQRAVFAIILLTLTSFTWQWQESRKQRLADIASIEQVTEEGRQALLAGDAKRAVPLLVRATSLARQRGATVTEASFLLARAIDATKHPVSEFSSDDPPLSQGLFSPNGQYLAGIDSRLRIVVWDIAAQRQLLCTEPQHEAVYLTAFSEDSRQLLSVQESIATVWDVEKGSKSYDCIGHRMDIRWAEFDPTGERVATASVDNTACIWSDQGTRRVDLLGHKRSVMYANFDPLGRRVVTASRDQTLRIWDSRSGQSLVSIPGIKGLVDRVVFSPDARFVVTGVRVPFARVEMYDATTGHFVRMLPLSEVALIFGPEFTDDGTRCIAVTDAADNHALRVWDLISGEVVATLSGHTSPVTSFDMTADGSHAASGCFDKTTRVWELTSGAELLRFSDSSTDLTQNVALTSDGGRLLTSGEHGSMVVRSLAGNALLDNMDGTVLAASASHLLVADHQRHVRLLDRKDERLADFTAAPGSCVAMHDPSNTIAIGSYETGDISVKLPGSSTSLAMSGIAPNVQAIRFNATATKLIARSNINPMSTTLRVIDIPQQRVVATLEVSVAVLATGFDSHDEAIVALDKIDAVEVQKLADASSVCTLKPTASVRVAGLFTADGKQFAIADSEGGATVWSVENGKLLSALRGHSNTFVNALAFHPSGKLLATGGNDKSVRVWSVSSAKLLAVFSAHRAPITRLFWSSDGSSLIATCADETSRVWNVSLNDSTLSNARNR